MRIADEGNIVLKNSSFNVPFSNEALALSDDGIKWLAKPPSFRLPSTCIDFFHFIFDIILVNSFKVCFGGSQIVGGDVAFSPPSFFQPGFFI